MRRQERCLAALLDLVENAMDEGAVGAKDAVGDHTMQVRRMPAARLPKI